VNKGDIVLVPFPFTDLSQTKLRPAIVLWADSRNNDATLCCISSQGVENLNEGEFRLNPTDEELQGTGLKVVSKVRVTRILIGVTDFLSDRPWRKMGGIAKRFFPFFSIYPLTQTI